MASTASSSQRPQAQEAGPLPRKVGELGYAASQYSRSEHSHEGEAEAESPLHDVDLAERHPADRDYRPSAATSTASLPSAPRSSSTGTRANSSATSLPVPSITVSPTPDKSTGWIHRLTSCRAQPLLWGLQGCSLLRFLLIICVMAATVAGWAITIMRLNASNAVPAPPPDQTDPNNADSSSSIDQTSGAMFIFVHVAFAIGLLLELVFFERAVFQLRAERWRFKHPGQTRGGPGGGGGMGIAPWNRPPLPTYAAALGMRGTGDVEDDAIAVPPPPAYGNTRGSTLLLASFMPAALRRANSTRSTSSARSAVAAMAPGSRPVSYQSSEQDAQVASDADRAWQLERALATLEEGGQRASR